MKNAKKNFAVHNRSLTRLFSFFVICFLCTETECRSELNSNQKVCDGCLEHCQLGWSNNVNLKICQICLPSCSTRNLTQFFQTNKCSPVIKQEQTTAAPENSTSQNSAQQSCKRFHQDVSLAFQKFILTSYRTCTADLNFERERLRNCTIQNRRLQSEEALMEFFEERLRNSADVQPFTTERNPTENEDEEEEEEEEDEQQRWATIRSWAGIGGGPSFTNGNSEACPTRHRVSSPPVVLHVSGATVAVWAPRNKKQFFFTRECRGTTPNVAINGATCRNVKYLHKALVRVSKEMLPIMKSTRCKRISGTKFFICDEWIYLDTSCALYIS